MIHRILLLLLSGCLLLPLAACAGDGGEGSPSSDSVQSAGSGAGTDESTDSEGTVASSETKKMTAAEVLGAQERLVGLTDQKNGRILICDLAEEDWTDDNAVVWEYLNPSFKHIAGIKFRDSEYYGEKVVIFCYPVGACVMSYETKEILLQTSDIGWNPHSVELLPDGTFIVASSSDNLVSVFAPGQTKANQKVEFPKAQVVDKGDQLIFPGFQRPELRMSLQI